AGDTAALITGLVEDGYERATDDIDHARALVAAAAAAAPEQLPPAYYLGRDLLDLGDVHLGASHRIDPPLARAIDLVGEGDVPRAARLLAHCDPGDPDVAAATA